MTRPRLTMTTATAASTSTGTGLKTGMKTRPGKGTREGLRARARAWGELLRLPALFTVPGDALAGAAVVGARPNSRTLLAIGSSLCLYEAGMALNDWADRAEDAVERPHRPLPSGRVHPATALAAAGALTATGLALAARAGRPALTVAVPLAATVWSYDLTLKRTPAGPLAMAAARTLDLLLGATATATTTAATATRATVTTFGTSGTTATNTTATATPRNGATRAALPSALALGAHTFAVTTVSRRETQGGSSSAPLASLAMTGALAWRLTRGHATGRRTTGPGLLSTTAGLPTVLAAAYAATTARPLFHATLNPSPPLTQRAVGAGIRALIPLQAALTARAGSPGVALFTAALAPAARRFARKVSVT